ncbi:MAG TPA: hypothetical protein ENJ53_08240 [Phaeodactylibacter sp.]|nr:hypothetical protein [Phaeodactylibacter sp.]
MIINWLYFCKNLSKSFAVSLRRPSSTPSSVVRRPSSAVCRLSFTVCRSPSVVRRRPLTPSIFFSKSYLHLF